MADSVREQILKQIQTTLEGVTVGNGFGNTVASVQRFRQGGQSLTGMPVCVVMEGDDSVNQEGPLAGSYSLTSRTMQISVVIISQQDEETDARSAAEVMNSLAQDVQKAMQLDPTRGGLAIDTKETGIGEMDVEEGQPEILRTIGFRIAYRHRRTDPSIVG
jgi:hypothetical protein